MTTVLVTTDSRYDVDQEVIRQSAIDVLTRNRIKGGKVELGVAIVGDRRMRALNRQFLNLDETTDVLSFPLEEVSPASVTAESRAVQRRGFVRPPDKIMRLGDVVISYPQAVIEASTKGIGVEQEITDLLEHGVLHLLGIHHE